jgi:hypothetical protein
MIRFLFISVLFFLFGTNDGYSQYYGSGAYGGVDRSIGASTRQNRPSKKNAEKKDYADVYTEYLTKQLELDGLQQAAVKSIVSENKDSLEEISKSELPTMEKRDKMRLLNDKINAKVLKLLSKEQTEKFSKLIADAEKKAMTY